MSVLKTTRDNFEQEVIKSEIPVFVNTTVGVQTKQFYPWFNKLKGQSESRCSSFFTANCK